LVQHVRQQPIATVLWHDFLEYCKELTDELHCSDWAASAEVCTSSSFACVAAVESQTLGTHSKFVCVPRFARCAVERHGRSALVGQASGISRCTVPQ
jgi:hypothetical protein